MLRSLKAAVFGLLVSVGATAHAATIDTTPMWDGVSTIGSFGNPDTSTYGNTFTAPGGDLQSFTFHLDPLGSTLQFIGQVYAWTGSLFGGGGGGATGPALYTSASTSVGGEGLRPVTMNVGGLSLTTGAAYVALFTVSNAADYAATTGTGVWGLVPGSSGVTPGDGGFVFYNNGGDPTLLNTSAWDNFDNFGTSAWTAVFGAVPVPEPGSLALLAAALVGLSAARRSRRRA